jgi:hypothetical protein
MPLLHMQIRRYFNTICDNIQLLTLEYVAIWNKGNNKITELRTILQRKSQNY